jgi:hypothetical protein
MQTCSAPPAGVRFRDSDSPQVGWEMQRMRPLNASCCSSRWMRRRGRTRPDVSGSGPVPAQNSAGVCSDGTPQFCFSRSSHPFRAHNYKRRTSVEVLHPKYLAVVLPQRRGGEHSFEKDIYPRVRPPYSRCSKLKCVPCAGPPAHSLSPSHTGPPLVFPRTGYRNKSRPT